MRHDNTAPTEESQSDKFKALARELEADEDEARWDERLKKLTAQRAAPEVYWKVDYAKGAPGFCASRVPNGGLDQSPIFSTQEQVFAWLEAEGFIRSGEIEGGWVNPS